MKHWGERFFSSTRGQVVKLLRRGAVSVNELADVLDVSDNTVRSHLATLERDGLVRAAGKRPGVRKPETLYALTPEAEQLFPKAYHLLLNELISALDRRFEPDELDGILREVGRQLAPRAGSDPPPAESHSMSGTLRSRAEEALDVLKSIGGLAELQETEAGLVIRGHSCPLAASVSEHPEVCRLAEALLTEVVGAPVRELCERNGTPRCNFQIAAAGS